MKKTNNYKDPIKALMTEMTVRDVANALGLSSTGVTDIEQRALKKAKKIILARMKQNEILPD